LIKYAHAVRPIQCGNIISEETQNNINPPKRVDKYTNTLLSFFFIILIIPVKKDSIPNIAAVTIGRHNFKLLQKVAPPFSPRLKNIKNTARKIKKAIINPTVHLPK